MTEVAQIEAPKRTPTVVTSETAEAFYDAQLGITPEPEADPMEAAPKDEADEEIRKESKGNKKIESRFSELAKARREAEERAKTASDEAKKAREEREALQAERDALKAKYEPPKTDPLGPKPKLDQFANADEFELALTDWTADKIERDRAKKDSDERQAKEQQERAAAWKTRQDEARKEIADYDAKINGSAVQVSDSIRDAILESDAGPWLLHHLAANPDAAERLGKLSNASALRELGKLEAQLLKPKEEQKTPIAELKEEISRAPAPITPLRSSAGSDVPRVDGTGKYHGSYEQYKADRLAGKIK